MIYPKGQSLFQHCSATFRAWATREGRLWAGATMRRENGHPAICYTWHSRASRLCSSDCPQLAYHLCDCLLPKSHNRKLWIAKTMKVACPWGNQTPKSRNRSRGKDAPCSRLPWMTSKERLQKSCNGRTCGNRWRTSNDSVGSHFPKLCTAG